MRIEIGFDGGQVMSAMVAVDAADSLEQALAADGGSGQAAISIEAEDGRYTIVLGQVVYVKRFARDTRVGFGAAASSA
ncbi:MAG TPA: hypothetical protein VEH52_02710 [Gaiellaceae bacterium]|nr:hypothetical protein [Gaiellaceae bacterium]